jgi:hypothetical protein
MTKKQHDYFCISWISALYEAMFESRVIYLGDSQFEGLRLIKGTLPRQLHLDF